MRAGILAGLTVMLLGGAAEATLITVYVSGTVTGGTGVVATGSAFTGSFTYDSNATLTNSGSSNGTDYSQYSAITAISFQSGSFSVNFSLDANTHGGSFEVDNAQSNSSSDQYYAVISEQYSSYSQLLNASFKGPFTTIDDTALPTMLSQFSALPTDSMSYIDTRGTVIQGAVTAVSFTPPSVPEPATWATAIIGFGFIGVGLRRRKIAISPAF